MEYSKLYFFDYKRCLMNFIQREIYVEWHKWSELIWYQYDNGEIDWDQAVQNMFELMDKLNRLEEAKVRLYGESVSDN